MPTRRSVLATSSGALLATLAGCNVLESGDSDGDDSSNARRWLTGEVARIPYDDPPVVGESPEEPLFRSLQTGRPERARSIDALPNDAIQRISSQSTVADVSLPTGEVTEVTSLFDGDLEVAVGEFDAPDPPEGATEVGTHRDATLYTVETPAGSPSLHGYAIADGVCAFVSGQSSAEAVTASLRSLLDAEAGEGTPIEADGEIDRCWSFLEQGFFEAYYARDGERGGISMRADGDTVQRRSIMLMPTESGAEDRVAQVEQAAQSGTDGEDRGPYDFGPYEDVTVNRDGRAVTVEGSLPASDVAYPEFVAP